MRRQLSLLLIVLLSWQSLGWASQGFGRTQNLDHLTAHWQGIAHHHHDDDTHVDSSASSIAHLLSDGIFSAPTLMAGSVWPPLIAPASNQPFSRASTEHAPPFIEELPRPPRLPG